MTIPKKVKIGGMVYAVEITDKLDLGAANVSAEIDYRDLVIRISPQAQGKMEADFMHELMHGILDHLGYKDQDEQRVEALAQALYMVMQDNPDLFEEGSTPTLARKTVNRRTHNERQVPKNH